MENLTDELASVIEVATVKTCTFSWHKNMERQKKQEHW